MKSVDAFISLSNFILISASRIALRCFRSSRSSIFEKPAAVADRRKAFGALRAGDEYLFCYLARGSSKQYTELQVLSSSSVPTEKAAEIYQQNISVRMSESVGFGPGRRSCDGDDASKAYLDLNHVR